MEPQKRHQTYKKCLEKNKKSMKSIGYDGIIHNQESMGNIWKRPIQRDISPVTYENIGINSIHFHISGDIIIQC